MDGDEAARTPAKAHLPIGVSNGLVQVLNRYCIVIRFDTVGIVDKIRDAIVIQGVPDDYNIMLGDPIRACSCDDGPAFVDILPDDRGCLVARR
ncbi:hypothetical protein DSECCO2_456150 [anaerobic digester metagenome]